MKIAMVNREKAVLVTGGAGYIGSHACKALSQAGYVPVTYDNLVYGHEWAVRWGPLEQGDILDRARLDEVMSRYKPKAVVPMLQESCATVRVYDPQGRDQAEPLLPHVTW